MIVEMTEEEFKRLGGVIAFFQGYFAKRHPETEVREEVEKGVKVLKDVMDRGFKVSRHQN